MFSFCFGPLPSLPVSFCLCLFWANCQVESDKPLTVSTGAPLSAIAIARTLQHAPSRLSCNMRPTLPSRVHISSSKEQELSNKDRWHPSLPLYACVAFTLHMHYLPWPSSSSKLNSLTPCKVFVRATHTSCKLQLTKKTLLLLLLLPALLLCLWTSLMPSEFPKLFS